MNHETRRAPPVPGAGPAGPPAGASPAPSPWRVGGGLRGVGDVEFAVADAGDLAIVLGYPDRIGVDAAGNLAFAGGEDHRPLFPLTTLATVDQRSDLTLRPRAGAIPTGGMSGGPVFDARGRLLGVFVSVERAEGPGQPAYSFRVAPLRSVRRLLNELSYRR